MLKPASSHRPELRTRWTHQGVRTAEIQADLLFRFLPHEGSLKIKREKCRVTYIVYNSFFGHHIALPLGVHTGTSVLLPDLQLPSKLVTMLKARTASA